MEINKTKCKGGEDIFNKFADSIKLSFYDFFFSFKQQGIR